MPNITAITQDRPSVTRRAAFGAVAAIVASTAAVTTASAEPADDSEILALLAELEPLAIATAKGRREWQDAEASWSGAATNYLAFDEWSVSNKPGTLDAYFDARRRHGVEQISESFNEIADRTCALAVRMGEIPASTVEGLRAKMLALLVDASYDFLDGFSGDDYIIEMVDLLIGNVRSVVEGRAA